MKAAESAIICEGYHDRAFWAGILLASGCKDPGDLGKGARTPFKDPHGKYVVGGDFGFYSPSGQFIRVTPAHGKDCVLRVLKEKLDGRKTRPIANLVVSVDSDLMADRSGVTSSLSYDAVLHQVRSFEPTATLGAEREIKIDGGGTTVFLAPWTASDPVSRGMPNQQTMERVICASLMSIHPTWGEAVQNWLDARPEGPPAGPKSFAWSYLAGWYAQETGSYDGFCHLIWKRPEIADQLRNRLEACGIWRVAQILSA